MVSSSTYERILGVQVSRNLFSWREHTDKLLEELSTVMCGLRRGAQYFSFKQRLATAKQTPQFVAFGAIFAFGLIS